MKLFRRTIPPPGRRRLADAESRADIEREMILAQWRQLAIRQLAIRQLARRTYWATQPTRDGEVVECDASQLQALLKACLS